MATAAPKSAKHLAGATSRSAANPASSDVCGSCTISDHNTTLSKSAWRPAGDLVPVAPQFDRVRPELIEQEVIRVHGLRPGCAELVIYGDSI